MRKVNADDKRQAAELIELDGGDLRREPLDTRKATLALLLKQAAPGPAPQRAGLLLGDAGAFGLASTDAPQERALPSCGCDMVASWGPAALAGFRTFQGHSLGSR